MSYVLSRSICIFIGYIYPAYNNYKFLQSKAREKALKLKRLNSGIEIIAMPGIGGNDQYSFQGPSGSSGLCSELEETLLYQEQNQAWNDYWIAMAFFNGLELVADYTIYYIPFYNEMKILLVFLLAPYVTNGACQVYLKNIKPYLQAQEGNIDATLNYILDWLKKTAVANTIQFREWIFEKITTGANPTPDTVKFGGDKEREKDSDREKQLYSPATLERRRLRRLKKEAATVSPNFNDKKEATTPNPNFKDRVSVIHSVNTKAQYEFIEKHLATLKKAGLGFSREHGRAASAKLGGLDKALMKSRQASAGVHY